MLPVVTREAQAMALRLSVDLPGSGSAGKGGMAGLLAGGPDGRDGMRSSTGTSLLSSTAGALGRHSVSASAAPAAGRGEFQFPGDK